MKKIVHGLGFLLLWIVIAAVFSVALMLLWNWLMPAIFGLAAIGYWQALGLLVLTRLLFGGFHFGRGGHWHSHKRWNRLHERWHDMSPEEQMAFIRQRRNFGHRHPFFGYGEEEGMHPGPAKESEESKQNGSSEQK
jgi:hypothetical protein